MITKLGEAAATFRAVARVIELPYMEFKDEMLDENSPAYKAYYAGFDKLDTKTTMSATKAMERGSIPALGVVVKKIETTKRENQ